MLLMMGGFSMYTGLLYNELFSVAIDFGSNWAIPAATMGTNATSGYSNFTLPTSMVPANPSRTYEFGVDPAWNGAPNALTYYNSLKMKLSITFGVTQMVMGLILSAFNGIYFGHYVDVFFEFLPQLLFMLCLFGYMVFLIIFKWCVGFPYWATLFPGGTTPPFLLNVMIQMFLSPVNLKPENTVFHGQEIVQPVLLFTAIICVPVMLLVKPLYLRKVNQNRGHRIPTDESHETHGGDEEFDFSEIFVKQCIHTIEYVLGAISNTASYLRLWALSLAHSELSQVFWGRIFIFLYGFEESSFAAQIFFWYGLALEHGLEPLLECCL